MKSKIALVVILAAVISLVVWATPPAEEIPANGRILLWHEWQGVEAQVLNDLIRNFSELHPGVEVISVPISSGTIVNRFQDRSDAGLAPDIVLLDSRAVVDLAEAGLIRDVSGQIDLEKQPFLSSALTTVQDDDTLFGVPFSLHTEILFYNKTLVESPPASLTELQERVAGGERMALNANLIDALWGLGAYGGSLFDGEEQLAISQGAFINWLDFLQQAQALPGFILDTDRQRLRELFLAGEVAYYVGPSSDLPALQATLGAMAPLGEPAVEAAEEAGSETPEFSGAGLPEPGTGVLGIAALPVGPNDWQPSPILHTDAFVFSRVSSPQEQALSMMLVEFLTNAQQQTHLAAEGIGRIPAGAEIRRNRNLPESTVALAKQSRSAVAIPFRLRSAWDSFVNEGGEFNAGYTRALQGILSTSQFVDESAALIESQLGVNSAEQDLTLFCPNRAGSAAVKMTIWHALPALEADALQEIIANYEGLCPGVHVESTLLDSAEIIESYIAEAEAGGGPDMLLDSSRWTSQLAEQDLIADLSDYVRPEDLEPLIPEAAASMRYQGRLYGIPQSVSVLALLYNRDLVDTLPISLEELLIQINPEVRWALPMRFFYGFWGLEPFGGFAFNSETGLIEEQAGFVPWLSWLQAAQGRPGVDLTFEVAEATDAFAKGDAAFLVGGPWMLPQLREALGEENLGVSPLPSGPFGPGKPLLQVEGVMVNANRESAIDDAVDFIRFLSLPESQAILLDTGTHVSASVNADLEALPLLKGFQDEAKLAAVVDENSKFAAMEALGDQLYEDVLLNGVDPAAAVQAFEEAVRSLAESPE